MNSRIAFRLKLLFSFLLLGWFLWRTDLTQMLKVLTSVSLNVMISSVAAYFGALYFNAIKWRLLLENQPVSRLFRLTIIAQYYNLILPGQLAGEAVKAYMLGKGNKEAEFIAASVIIDRITGLIGLTLIALIGVLLSNISMANELAGWIGLTVAGFIGVLYLFQVKRFESAVQSLLLYISDAVHQTASVIARCRRLIEAWKQILDRPRRLILSTGYGIVFQLLCVGINYMFADCFGIPIGFWDWCWIFGVISVALIFPVTIGGIGIREGGFVFLLGKLGIPIEKAMAMSFSIFSLQLFGAFLGGILDLRRCKV